MGRVRPVLDERESHLHPSANLRYIVLNYRYASKKVHNKAGPYTVIIPANIEVRSDAPMFVSFFLLNEAHGTRESALSALNRMEGGIVANAGGECRVRSSSPPMIERSLTPALITLVRDSIGQTAWTRAINFERNSSTGLLGRSWIVFPTIPSSPSSPLSSWTDSPAPSGP